MCFLLVDVILSVDDSLYLPSDRPSFCSVRGYELTRFSTRVKCRLHKSKREIDYEIDERIFGQVVRGSHCPDRAFPDTLRWLLEQHNTYL